MFECKNVAALELEHINQTATYLGARLGMLGFIATREKASDAVQRKIYSVYNDSPAVPRKVVLVFSDPDMDTMIAMRASGQSPVPYAQGLYRQLRTKVAVARDDERGGPDPAGQLRGRRSWGRRPHQRSDMPWTHLHPSHNDAAIVLRPDPRDRW